MSTVSSFTKIYFSNSHLVRLIPNFFESNFDRPWNYDRDGDDIEFHQGKGPSPLEVVDQRERPTKQFFCRRLQKAPILFDG